VADIPALIVLNKADLPETAALADKLAPYGELGYTLLRVSALEDLAPLEQRLAGNTTIFVGASGVGKSTLLNRLVPEANAATREISQALDTGKHTTTHARMYALPGHDGGDLIDSPGMQEFGLKHLDQDSLMAAFPEIRERLGQCRFYNCRHLKEPGCAVLEAAKDGAILANRLKVYHALLAGLR
jgi:ribosome biogenesis GTPase